MSTSHAVHPALEHRRFLSHPSGFRPFSGTDLFTRIGGQAAVARLVDGLYDRIESDEALRPLFASDLAAERERQKLFFTEWLGGERRYNEVAYSALKHKHDALPITRSLAGRWLGHFRRALKEAVAEDTECAPIFEQASLLALALVNTDEQPTDEEDAKGARRYLPQGSTRTATCGLGSPEHPLNRARELAHRGKASELSVLLQQEPEALRHATHAASVMQAAVLAGKREIVELLLKRGVDVDKPNPLGGLFLTPLCAARLKRRSKVEALLLEHGAKNDVFTASFLGELSELDALLAIDRNLAQAFDPAGDILDVTPIHHAVEGGQLKALRLLLQHSHEPVIAGARALRAAAKSESLLMVELLLEHGADATRVGAGRWVLHREIAPLLARAGARVEPGGDWIRLSCTGNQGRKDDPEYVRALLQHGAKVDDRRRNGVMATGATALHYVAKAGFLQTIQVLLENGADPNATDDEGQKPLDWLTRASKSVDKNKVRELLSTAG
jgi:truncated hemoglobin YjbI/ankyrin repeat protein